MMLSQYFTDLSSGSIVNYLHLFVVESFISYNVVLKFNHNYIGIIEI